MKQPNLNNLRRDRAGTRRIRAAANKGFVKITINIDQDSLEMLRVMARETGVPYQRLLNSLLKEGMKGRETVQARMDRLEHELTKMKRRLAA